MATSTEKRKEMIRGRGKERLCFVRLDYVRLRSRRRGERKEDPRS